MKTKEKVIRQSIEQIEKRLKEIKSILEPNPLIDICKIRIEFQKLLEENKTIEQRTSKEFIAKIEELDEKEKELFVLVEKQKDSIKLIDEEMTLKIELTELQNELYYIK